MLDHTFATLAGDGVPVVRSFLLCDARSGVRFDAEGVPTGLDQAVFPDIDALCAAARRHGLRLMPVLLDFHLCAARRVVNGVHIGGRDRLITDPAARLALINLVLRPIVERYGEDDTIIAWDLMNEPEWCLERGRIVRRQRIPVDTLRTFLREAVHCVRMFARQPITVGCAGTAGLDLVRPLGLDFYQVHWYEHAGWAALSRPVSSLGVGDSPVILGEFPGRSRVVVDVLDAAKHAGYAGAFVWSMRADDEFSAYPAELVKWAQVRPLQ